MVTRDLVRVGGESIYKPLLALTLFFSLFTALEKEILLYSQNSTALQRDCVVCLFFPLLSFKHQSILHGLGPWRPPAVYYLNSELEMLSLSVPLFLYVCGGG